MRENDKQDLEISIKPTSLRGDVIETGAENLVKFTAESMEKAFNIINDGAVTFAKSINKLKKEENSPDSVVLEFGVQVDVRGNIFIAEAAANSSFKVSFTWNTGRREK